MDIKCSVYHEMLEHFTDSAKERLIKATEEYANNIVKEAIRIEESARLEGAKPDITDSFVKMAIISNSRDRKQNNKMVDCIMKLHT